MSKKINRSDLLFLLLGIVLPFALRLEIVVNSNLTFFSDDAIYASFARFWSNGEWGKVIHPFWPPLYPLLSASINSFINNWELSLRLTSLVSITLLSIPIYLLTKIILGRSLALISAITFVWAPPFSEYSIFPFSDMLATTLIVAAIVATFWAVSFNRQQSYILAGVLFGLAFLTRSEGLMFFILSLFYFSGLFLFRYLRGKNQIRDVLSIFLFVVMFLFTVSPYVIGVGRKLGYFSLSPKVSAQIQQGHAFAYKNGSTWAQEIWSVKNLNYQSSYFKGGGEYVLENYNYLLDWFAQKLERWKDIFLHLFPGWTLPLMTIGVLAVVKNRYQASLIYILYLLLTAIPITIFSIAAFDTRYLLWTIPFFLIFIFLGLQTSCRKTHVGFFCPLAGFVLIVFLQWLSMNSFDPLYQAREFTKKHHRPQIKIVGQWMKDALGDKEPVIMTRHEAFEFYSRGTTVYLPQTDYDSLIDYAQRKNVDFLVAWERELAGEPLAWLANKESSPRDLKKVLTHDTREGPIVVYTFFKPEE